MKPFADTNFRNKMVHLISDEKRWTLFQNACVFIVLGSTAAIMSLVNFITGQGSLTWFTLGFSAACFLNLLLTLLKGNAAKSAMILFAVEITVLFLYFIIFGIPDGFSVIWTAMLPSFGLLLFEIRYGSTLSLIIFAALIFFFWVPLGQSLLQYEYSQAFMMRFPLFYLACFAVAYLLERTREVAHNALRESQKNYEYLCYHDALTKKYNRFWLQSIIAEPEKYQIKPAAVAILDIDNFKLINDSFGHPNGDIVIQDIGDTINNTLNGSGDLCRWGGDEFLILFHTDIDAYAVCRRIVDAVHAHIFNFDNKELCTTLSIGLVTTPHGSTDDIEALIHQADVNLYAAKDKGRNCMISSSLGE